METKIMKPKLKSNKKGKKVWETQVKKPYGKIVPRDNRKGINLIAWVGDDGRASCTYRTTDMTYAEKAVLLTELEYLLEKIKRKHFDHAVEFEEEDKTER